MPNSTDDGVKKFIFTDEEAGLIEDHLENLKSEVYKTDFNITDFIEKRFTKAQEEMFLSEVTMDSNPEEIVSSVENVLNKLKKNEVLTLRINFDPTVSFINWVKEYLSEKVENSVVIKILVDESVMAGAVLEYKGRVSDLSIKEAVLKALND